MPFTTAELQRIKTELGMNAVNVGADFYINIQLILESVVNEFIDDEVETTATLGTPLVGTGTPTPVTLTLLDATNFPAGARIFVDVDTRTENATIQSKSGSDIVVQLKNSHDGTFPVALEGPIPLVRDILRKILAVKDEMAETVGYGALKAVDEIEFYSSGEGTTAFGNLGSQLMHWREELANILGIPNFWRTKPGGGGFGARMAVM